VRADGKLEAPIFSHTGRHYHLVESNHHRQGPHQHRSSDIKYRDIGELATFSRPVFPAGGNVLGSTSEQGSQPQFKTTRWSANRVGARASDCPAQNFQPLTAMVDGV
jgi:hypothetical protein